MFEKNAVLSCHIIIHYMVVYYCLGQYATDFAHQFSRQCPGKKDFVTVRTDQVKVQKQKRMLLVNLKELYLEFKKKHENAKVGLSKFCSLRPRWCVTVDSPGTQSVCVCEIHKNLKLMVAALPGTIDYKELMAKQVCSLESRDCMIHRCEKCPSRSDFLEALLENADLDRMTL